MSTERVEINPDNNNKTLEILNKEHFIKKISV